MTKERAMVRSRGVAGPGHRLAAGPDDGMTKGQRLGPATTRSGTVAPSFVIPNVGMEKCIGPATTLDRTVALSFVIPSAARNLRFYVPFLDMFERIKFPSLRLP